MNTLELKNAEKHYWQLSPHDKERDTAEYLRLALQRIRELEETEQSEVSSTALLPCPFCGGQADYEESRGICGTHWSVGCNDEKCHGYQSITTFSRKADALKAWNKRTDNANGEVAPPSPDHKD